MREILFRGFHECENGTQRAVVNGKEYKGEWVEGNVIKIYAEYLQREVMAIVKQGAIEDMYEGFSYEEVDPETVGQFTGLCDKNGAKIFEGDVCKARGWSIGWKEYFVVKFEDYRFRIVGTFGNEYTPLQKYVDFQKLEVVGNIYDNPELLKKENE